MNQIFRLINTFPDKEWYWPGICNRNDITFEFVLAHLDDYPWEWLELSANSRIGSWKNVQAHPELPWVFSSLVNNLTVPLSIVLYDPKRFDIISTHISHGCLNREDFTVDMAIANYPHIRVNWAKLSRHSSLTFENVKTIVRLEITTNLEWDYIFVHKNITVRDFIEDFDNLKEIRWDFYRFMMNPNVYIEDLMFLRPRLQAAGIDEDEMYAGFSFNVNLSIHYVIANFHLPWNWSEITLHKDLTIDLIASSPHTIPWCRYNLSLNPTLTLAFIESYGRVENININWDYYAISQNPAFTLQDVMANPNFQWKRDGISINPSIPPSQILADQNLWRMTNILHRNPLLTIEDVLEYPTYKWNWPYLYHADFSAKAMFMLQRWWKFRGKLAIRCRKRTTVTALEKVVKCEYLSKHIASYIYIYIYI
jgi:hypothetical protein